MVDDADLILELVVVLLAVSSSSIPPFLQSPSVPPLHLPLPLNLLLFSFFYYYVSSTIYYSPFLS